MSYALLWIETLISSLLWTALWLALACRWRRAWTRWVGIVIAMVPLAKFGLLLAAAGVLKFSFQLESNWFVYALSLLLASLIGTLLLLIRSRRRLPASPDRAAMLWPPGRLALGLLTSIAITIMTFWNMDLEVRAHIGAMRSEAGALMLAVSPPMVNDSQNAAFVYEKAFSRLARDPVLAGSDSPLRKDLPGLKDPATIVLLERHKVTIRLLREAAAMPDCRFEHDYARPTLTLLFPELWQCHVSAELLCLDARAEVSHGNIESAIADINAAYRLSRAMQGEPIVISLLVAIGIDARAADALQEVLPAVTRPEQLSGLKIGDDSQFPHALARACQGEEAIGLAGFCDIASERMTFEEMEGMTSFESAKPNFYVPMLRPMLMLMRVFLLSDDAANYRQLTEEYQQAAGEPYYKNPHKGEDAAKFRRAGIITSTIAPALSRINQTVARGQAIHADAQVAIAMTRYRLEHGQYPATLDALVPTCLDEIPLDPFDGKSLRMVHKSNDWIIYSIGPDGIDDGGVPFDQHGTKKGDIGVKLVGR